MFAYLYNVLALCLGFYCIGFWVLVNVPRAQTHQVLSTSTYWGSFSILISEYWWMFPERKPTRFSVRPHMEEAFLNWFLSTGEGFLGSNPQSCPVRPCGADTGRPLDGGFQVIIQKAWPWTIVMCLESY